MERRLKITEVAVLYQISARTLRYYEEIGILNSHRKADSTYREYDRQQCERLEVILLLRRLSFSVKMIAELLSGENAFFHAALQEKIEDSRKRLLEVRETDRLLRDLQAELSRKPIAALKTADVLREYAYLTKKTERVIPMDLPQNSKYRVAISTPFAGKVCGGGESDDLPVKIRALRAELEKESITMPIIRIYDNADLPENQAVVMWDEKEVWRKDYQSTDALACIDDILTQIRLNCRKNKSEL